MANDILNPLMMQDAEPAGLPSNPASSSVPAGLPSNPVPAGPGWNPITSPTDTFIPPPSTAAAAGAPPNPIRPPQPVASPAAKPAPSSFAGKLLQAIGGVLSAASGAAQVAGAPNPAQQLNEMNARKDMLAKQKQEEADKQRQMSNQETEEQRIQQREDDEAAARIAEANVRIHTSRQSDYRQGTEYMQKQVAQGQADLKNLEGAEVPAQIIQHEIDGGQINALLKQGKINTHEYTVIPSGLKQTGVDAEGNPTMDYQYDVVKVPDKWTPTEDQVARIRTVPGYEKFTSDTAVTGQQVLAALSQADLIKSTHDAMNKARTEAGLAEFTEQQKADSAAFTKSGDWLRFLNAYNGDPVSAAQHILQDPKMADKYSTSLYKDVMSQFATDKDPSGVTGYSTMLHQAQEDANNRLKIVTMKNGQGTIGGGALTDQMKAQIAALPKDKQAVVKKYDPDTQSTLYSIAFGPGDISIDAFPTRITGTSGQLDREHAEGVIRQLNPNWNEGQYKATQAAYKQVTFGRNGQDVETYNNLLDHMANAQDVIEDSLRKYNPKFLNSAINLAENEGWGTQAMKIQTALEPVKTEFESLMNNGHALHADQAALYDAMVNKAETPAQLEAAFKNFGATGAVRLLGLNDQYKKIAGNNLPGILRKETMDSARHLNLDPNTMKQLGTLNAGDTLFHNPNWTAGTPEEQSQSVDTQQQQRQAMAESAKQLAQQAMQTGNAPRGTAGIAISTTDGNWYYVDAQHTPISRVQ